MTHHCPQCQRILYNRRLERCGFCGSDIPAELRFTPEEAAILARKMEELEEARKQRQLADERRTPLGDLNYSATYPWL